MVLFQAVVQVAIAAVDDCPAERPADRARVGVVPVRCHAVRGIPYHRTGAAEKTAAVESEGDASIGVRAVDVQPVAAAEIRTAPWPQTSAVDCLSRCRYDSHLLQQTHPVLLGPFLYDLAVGNTIDDDPLH